MASQQEFFMPRAWVALALCNLQCFSFKSTANSYAVTLAERDTGNERRMQRRHMFALRAFASPSNLLTSAFGDVGVHEAYAAA